MGQQPRELDPMRSPRALFGWQLRCLREKAGLSQETLGLKVRLSGSAIYIYEKGRSLPTDTGARLLDTVLGANGLLYTSWQLAIRGDTHADSDADSAGQAPPEPTDAATDRGYDARPPAVHIPTDGAWPPTTIAAVLAADAADSARFARQAAATNTGPLALEQLDADVERLSRCYVSRPLFDLFLEIRSLRAQVFKLLSARQHPNQTRHLYLVAGQLCGLTTHIALDLGHYDAADTHARTALQCAELAAHPPFQAWVRSVQSLIAYWNGSDTRAVALAREGRTHRSTGTINARLCALEARALARLGDHHASRQALADAEAARESIKECDPIGGVFTFPEAKQNTYAGTTYLALAGTSGLRRAIECSTRAIELYCAAPDVDRSSGDLLAAHLDLACAHLAAGDLAGAILEIELVLATPPERRTASIRSRMRALSGALSAPPYRGCLPAAGLYEQIRDFARPVLVPSDAPGGPTA